MWCHWLVLFDQDFNQDLNIRASTFPPDETRLFWTESDMSESLDHPEEVPWNDRHCVQTPLVTQLFKLHKLLRGW